MKITRGIAVALTAAILVSGGGVATSLVTAQPAQAASSQPEIQAAVTQILNETNAERAKVGLAPLKLNTQISAVSQNWTESMAAAKSMTHNPDYQFQMPQPWMRVGENVGQGYTKDTIVAAWMASPGHKANILGDFTHIGLGYWVDETGRGWFTQNFGKYDTPVLTTINEPITTVDKYEFTAVWERRWEENVDSYRAELRTADGILLQTKTVPVADSTVTFDGLTDLTSYNVRIVSQATNALGEYFSSPVKSFNVTTLEDLPTISAVTDLAVTPGENSLSASWTAPADYNGTLQAYAVELFKAGVLVNAVQATNPNYIFTNLTSNTDYAVRVTATASVRSKVATSTATAVTKTLLSSLASVTEPTNVTTVPDSKSIKATWDAPVSQTGTDLKYIVTLSTAGKPDVVVETTSPSYVFSNLLPATDYGMRVQASVTSENKATKVTSTGVLANVRTLVEAVTVSAPNAPSSLNVVPDYNTANLSWVAPTGVVGNINNYTVTLKQAGKADQIFKVAGTSYAVSGLLENTAYTVTVVANVSSVDGSKTATSPSTSGAIQTFARFTDSKYSSFPREVDWMKTAGISTGYANGTYDPFGTVTREQMAAFMYRMAGRPAFTATSPFIDAKYSSFPLEVNWMKTAGISTGYWDGTYAPFGTVTREQMAAFMHRYAVNVCSVNIPASKEFVDARYSSFPADVAWMGGAGISTGYWDGTYRPFDPVTREQMAAFMYRLNNYINNNGGCRR